MLIGMAVAALIYVLVAMLSSMLVPAADLAAAKSGALFRVLEVGRARLPAGLFAAIGLFAVINSALINMLMASRLLYGMANERVLPRDLRPGAPDPAHAVGLDRVHQRRSRSSW